MSLHRNTLAKYFSRSGHVVSNAVLRVHCAPLRSATISIGRAHLSLVREVCTCIDVYRFVVQWKHIRNMALQKRTTYNVLSTARVNCIAAMTKTTIGRLINFLAKCSHRQIEWSKVQLGLQRVAI